MDKKKIVITGGAGLVGQNLVELLIQSGDFELVVLDRNRTNLAILSQRISQVQTHEADLSVPGSWQSMFTGAEAVVMLHAQIGGTSDEVFERNNVDATKNVLNAMTSSGARRLIHVSSSVVNSLANDSYVRTKLAQEDLVRTSGLEVVVLRPTLMFGWFDRKHLGWLSRFMKKSPIFPIPGNGKFLRQPLFVGDFCKILVACIEDSSISGVHDVSGLERVTYLEIVRMVREATRARTLLLRIPVRLFRRLLWAWSIFDRNPPFTVHQLDALVIPEEFPVTGWPKTFGVEPTPLAEAVQLTFSHPVLSHVVLEF